MIVTAPVQAGPAAQKGAGSQARRVPMIAPAWSEDNLSRLHT